MDMMSTTGRAGEIESLAGLRAFVRVAEAGGFAEAARRHGLTASGLAKAVGRLEVGLGATLLHRTTRTVRLTEEGEALLERARRVLDEVADAEAVIAGARAEPSGHLRISVPVAFGEFVLAEALPRFLAEHPRVSVEAHLDDRMVRLAEEGYDLAVRIAPRLADSALVARALGPHRVIAVAAPGYLAARGAPRTPADLGGHECLAFAPPGLGRPLPWVFEVRGRRVEHAPHGRLRLNSNLAMLRAAAAGHGVALLPDYVAHGDVEAGTLRRVLEDAPVPPGTISLVRSPDRRPVPKVTAFAAFLQALVA